MGPGLATLVHNRLVWDGLRAARHLSLQLELVEQPFFLGDLVEEWVNEGLRGIYERKRSSKMDLLATDLSGKLMT